MGVGELLLPTQIERPRRRKAPVLLSRTGAPSRQVSPGDLDRCCGLCGPMLGAVTVFRVSEYGGAGAPTLTPSRLLAAAILLARRAVKRLPGGSAR